MLSYILWFGYINNVIPEGDVFAQRIKLGGTLIASEDSSAVSGQTKETKEKAMKVSAAASFSSSFAQGSASASHSHGGKEGDETKTQSFENSLAWEATGGDTLLCNKYAVLSEPRKAFWYYMLTTVF